MNFSSDRQKTITIVIFGRTGAGKSYLANLLAGQAVFKIGNQLYSETSSTTSYTTTLHGYPNFRIRIIDTPGFADNRPDMPAEKFLSDTLCFLNNLGEGFHVGIYCISAKTRVDSHDVKEIQLIGTLLGQDVFKHTLIAVTQANMFKDKERMDIHTKFPIHLPKILSDYGLDDFGPNKILFADADNFKQQFLEPFTEIIKDAPIYQPQIAQEIDPQDPESIKRFLATPEMQAYMKQYEKMLAEQKKETEEMKAEVGRQAAKCQQLQQESLYAQQMYQQKIDCVSQQLRDSKISSKRLEEQYIAYQREQEEKLGQVNQRLADQEQQSMGYQRRNQEMESEISNLRNKAQELEIARVAAAQHQQAPANDSDDDDMGKFLQAGLKQIVGGIVGIIGGMITKNL